MKHEQHYSAPFTMSMHSPRIIRVFLRYATILSAISILTACGNSTEVENNTNPGNGSGNASSGPLYLGPPALTDEVQRFKTEFWNPLAADNRCGQCHTPGQAGADYPFVDLSDINNAFAAATNIANNIVDRGTPANSRAVIKVSNGHQCWLGNDPATAASCGDIIEGYIDRWTSGLSKVGGRDIVLSAPNIFAPGESRNFPATALDGTPNFKTSIYDPILAPFCAECHSDSAEVPQAPFFASADIDVAYAAAMSKINLDAINILPGGTLEPLPLDSSEQSRFVTRILDLHNCWTADCASDADDMRLAIFDFAQGIPLTAIDPALITSSAMDFTNATLASGGNRYESDQIALWEFKTGEGNTAYDTSGIEPAMNLEFNGSVSWVLGYGVDFSNGGYASAPPVASKKLNDLISLSNSTYSIEAWVIPANVTQENRRIISYASGDGVNRNFALSQTMYQYEYFNRSTNTGADGAISLLTNDEDEDLQSALQHVVATFDPVNGRRLYINGVFTDDTDTPESQGGTLPEWQDSFPFIIGGEIDSDSAWNGTLRLVAIHNSALTAEQITQNFNVGVGQKYFMLFSVADLLGPNESEAFIMMQTELYDGTAYLFNNPVFINLDGEYIPSAGIPIEGMRIGINGREAETGQVFGNINLNINSADYTVNGQTISRLGTVIPVGKGPENDEFFLTFERIGNNTNLRNEASPIAPAAPADAAPVPDFGLKTFDEINTSMSLITGVPTTNSTITTDFATYKQQLPAIEDINTFLPSHQMGVAQLAMSYCNQLVIADKALAANDPDRFFQGFDFTLLPATAFTNISSQIIDPLLVGIMNLDNTHNLDNQPNPVVLRNQLSSTGQQNLLGTEANPAASVADPTGIYDFDSLLTQMPCDSDVATPAPVCSALRTEQIVIATCAAIIGSAMTIIQ